jgi:redox-sensitive bicupin YhaK (pirin superfamily)
MQHLAGGLCVVRMSLLPATEPVSSRCPATPSIATIIDARPRDLGGFKVGRLLPSSARRLVGPFIFFDHMGPAQFGPGEGIDVRPHPHICLATVTYLFEGEIIHRDSLGSRQAIRPGDINWMTAGRGIVHSERTSPELRKTGSKAHGLQLWVALPLADEETSPEFHHHPADTLPALDREGARIRVLAGTAYGATSPVHTFSPLFYVDVAMPARCTLPVPRDHEERAAYVIQGAISCGAEHATPGRMLVFMPGAEVALRAESDSRVVLVGGAPLDGQRHIWWNFVASSKERIEQAKRDWKEQRFPKVPGDEVEFIPLPE